MTLSERLKALKPDQPGDLIEIIKEAETLEADLTAARNLVTERDGTISELRKQTNQLYSQILTGNASAGQGGDPKESWEDLEGMEALDKFLAEHSEAK